MVDLMVAKLPLKAGTNVISFTRDASAENSNNYNIAGIAFISLTQINLGAIV